MPVSLKEQSRKGLYTILKIGDLATKIIDRNLAYQKTMAIPILRYQQAFVVLVRRCLFCTGGNNNYNVSHE